MQRSVRHVDIGHIAKIAPLGMATQQADGTAVGHHQHALSSSHLSDIVQCCAQAIAKCRERFGTWWWVCDRISPELPQRIALLLGEPFDAYALPIAEVIFR